MIIIGNVIFIIYIYIEIYYFSNINERFESLIRLLYNVWYKLDCSVIQYSKNSFT